MEKIINVGGKEVLFRATGATPLNYRNAFAGKDIFKDLMSLEGVDEGSIEGLDMGIFERIAYVMSDAIPKHISFEDWLDSFELMDIMIALPEIMELWEANGLTQSEPVKNT